MNTTINKLTCTAALTFPGTVFVKLHRNSLQIGAEQSNLSIQLFNWEGIFFQHIIKINTVNLETAIETMQTQMSQSLKQYQIPDLFLPFSVNVLLIASSSPDFIVLYFSVHLLTNFFAESKFPIHAFNAVSRDRISSLYVSWSFIASSIWRWHSYKFENK